MLKTVCWVLLYFFFFAIILSIQNRNYSDQWYETSTHKLVGCIAQKLIQFIGKIIHLSEIHATRYRDAPITNFKWRRLCATQCGCRVPLHEDSCKRNCQNNLQKVQTSYYTTFCITMYNGKNISQVGVLSFVPDNRGPLHENLEERHCSCQVRKFYPVAHTWRTRHAKQQLHLFSNN